MAVQNVHDSFTITRIAAATIGPYLRVKLDANGQLALAGLNEAGVGYLTERGAVSGEPAPYRSHRAPEFVGIANEAVAVGSKLYCQANGKVSDTIGTATILAGVSGTAAAADGDAILIVPADDQF
jgi:hypothetical protein